MACAQMGKTAAVILPFIGYSISQNPGTMLLLTGHSDLSKEAMEKVDFMIDNTGLRPLIRPNVLRAKNQRTGDTNLSKEFPGGDLKGGSATNHNMLRQRDIMLMIVDDMDAAKMAGKATGSTKKLIEQRQAAYGHKRKTLFVSSPQMKGQSNIEHSFKLGDQRYWNVPCPCCNKMIVLKWTVPIEGKDTAGIYYKTDSMNRVIEDSVGYVCQLCAGFFTEKPKYEMNLAGVWVPTATSIEPNHHSYQISALYAPPGAYNWTYYAQWFAGANPPDAPANISENQSFTNVAMGETFEIPSEELDSTQLQNNITNYEVGVIPYQLSIKQGNGPIVMLTCAADMNGTEEDARLDYEIVAWAESGASYSVTHGSIGTFVPREGQMKFKADRERFTYHHHTTNSVWPLFEEILQAHYPTDVVTLNGQTPAGPQKMGLFITALDTGHYTQLAYTFVDNSNANIVGVKGDKDAKYRKFGIDTPVFHAAKERNKLYILEANQLKDQVAALMSLKYDPGNDERQPAGFMNYPIPTGGKYLPANFFSHYEAEQRKIETKEGEGIASRWEKKNSAVQNHFWDVRCYNLAAREIMVYLLMKELKVEQPHKRTWADYVIAVGGGKKN